MSRETDSSSSRPQGGRGGSPYPQGSDPYGTGNAAETEGAAAPGGAPEAKGQGDERKTETTLTTRIRINIPGSRPIPPVVMRTPVSDDEGGADTTGSGPGSGAGSGGDEAVRPGAAGPASPLGAGSGSGLGSGTLGGPAGFPGGPASGIAGGAAGAGLGAGGAGGAGEGESGSGEFTKRTSDWFAPRKSKQTPAADPAPSAGQGEQPYGAQTQYGSGAQDPYGTGSGVGQSYGSGESYGGDPYGASRYGGDQYAGEPYGGDPYDTGATPFPHPDLSPPETTMSFPSLGARDGLSDRLSDPLSDPLLDGPADSSQRDAAHGLPGSPGTDSGADPLTPPEGFPALGELGGLGGLGGLGAPGASGSAGASDASGVSQGPSGPTTGPVTGDMALPPHPESGPEQSQPSGESPASSTLGLGTGPAPFAPGGIAERMLREEGGLDAQKPPAPAPDSSVRQGMGPGGEGSDAADGGQDDGRVAGDTLVSGIPRVGSGRGAQAGLSSSSAPSPFAPFAESVESLEAASPAGPRPTTSGTQRSAPRSRDAARAAGSAPKGRSKLALAGAALVAVIGIAYGTGLLMDHADVPSGTNVLGVNIGGMTKHGATKKLEKALGNRTTEPFTISASGRQTQLRPSVAGLTLDTEGTVRRAAGRDYNPISVIGSIFGVERKPAPALKVDKEKMASALTHVSQETGDGGAPTDGMIKFIRGKAVPIHGKAHRGIDDAQASAALRHAYLTRAASGGNATVKLPVSMQQPKVGDKEINRAMRQFAKPAMSGLVTIKAGHAKIQFSPQKSLPKFLSMKPVNGTLVDTYNLPALQQLYGTTFSGVKISRGNGAKTPVMPQDVAGALRLALKQTNPAKRVQEIPVNGS